MTCLKTPAVKATSKKSHTKCKVKGDTFEGVILCSPLHTRCICLDEPKINPGNACSIPTPPPPLKLEAEGNEACRTTFVYSFTCFSYSRPCFLSQHERVEGKFSNRLNINFGACVCVRTPLLRPHATLSPFPKDSRWCIES